MLSIRAIVRQGIKRVAQKVVRVASEVSRRPSVIRIGDKALGRTVDVLSRLHLLHEAKGLAETTVGAFQRHGLTHSGLLSVAPHNLRLYEYFIRQHLSAGEKFITSRELYTTQNSRIDQACLLLRHDVDYTPEQLHLFADVERDLGVRSDFYVILDDKHYDIKPYAETLKRLAREGFVVGLHTLAPAHDDFYSVLRREIQLFTEIMDCPPKYFTIHGPSAFPERPHNWIEVREQFIKKIQQRMTSFGFEGSHNIGGIDEWIEDSGMGGEFAYLSMNWIEKWAERGRVLGVLAHPDHWTVWPPRWRVDPEEIKEHPLIHDFVCRARRFNPQMQSHRASSTHDPSRSMHVPS